MMKQDGTTIGAERSSFDRFGQGASIAKHVSRVKASYDEHQAKEYLCCMFFVNNVGHEWRLIGRILSILRRLDLDLCQVAPCEPQHDPSNQFLLSLALLFSHVPLNGLFHTHGHTVPRFVAKQFPGP